jgi:hypothetical protein
LATDDVCRKLGALGQPNPRYSSNLSREAFREPLSELRSKVHKPSVRRKRPISRRLERGCVFGAALVPRIAIAVARPSLLRFPPMWFVS